MLIMFHVSEQIQVNITSKNQVLQIRIIPCIIIIYSVMIQYIIVLNTNIP